VGRDPFRKSPGLQNALDFKAQRAYNDFSSTQISIATCDVITAASDPRPSASTSACGGSQPRRQRVSGGEPFLLPDIGEIVAACAAAAATTIHGMLFAGRRLETLRSLPSERVMIQISLDSPPRHPDIGEAGDLRTDLGTCAPVFVELTHPSGRSHSADVG
jgi:hypothetical protein